MPFQVPDLALFCRLALLGSFSAVARERNVAASQITRALLRLESGSGMRLVHRTTHGLSLTEEGNAFLAYCRQVTDSTEQLSAQFAGKRDAPSGWVTVSVSAVLAECIVAASAAELYARFPKIHLDIRTDDRVVDLAKNGIDIALRTGTPRTETLVARRIGCHGRSLYASPAYLQAAGTPMQASDLVHHRLLTSSASAPLERWTESLPGMEAHTRTDNSALHLSLVLHGLGISQLNDLVAAPLVRDGRLRRILAETPPARPVPIYAVMLAEQQRLPKIRACIDHWAQWLDQLPRLACSTDPPAAGATIGT
jgi:DNA-binding transcriptional LysR family regulator